VGLGRLWLALLSILLTWFILAIIGKIERKIEQGINERQAAQDQSG
jgi:hypothetical protein